MIAMARERIQTLGYQKAVINVIFSDDMGNTCNGKVQMFLRGVHLWAYQEARQFATAELPCRLPQRMVASGDPQKSEACLVL